MKSYDECIQETKQIRICIADRERHYSQLIVGRLAVLSKEGALFDRKF